jgi:hypothetical protein
MSRNGRTQQGRIVINVSETPLEQIGAVAKGAAVGIAIGMVLHWCLHIPHLAVFPFFGGMGLLWWLILVDRIRRPRPRVFPWELAVVELVLCIVANVLPWQWEVHNVLLKSILAGISFAIPFYCLLRISRSAAMAFDVAGTLMLSVYVCLTFRGYLYHDMTSSGWHCAAFVFWHGGIGVFLLGIPAVRARPHFPVWN